MPLDYFEITIMYQTSSTLGDIYEDIEEDSVLKIKIRNEEGGEFKTDTGYFDLILDPIVSLSPKYLYSKDGDTRKYFTEITFESGNTEYALGKPESVYKKLNEYYDKFPEKLIFGKQEE